MDGGEKDDGKVSFKTQTVAGGSRGEETRLCSACCLVQKRKKKKKNDDEEETLENNSNDHYMTVRTVITHTRSVKGPQLGLPCFQEKFDV